MVDYIANQIYLGNRPPADTLEGAEQGATENPGVLLGTYDQDTGLSIVEVTESDLEGATPGSPPNGFIEEDVTNFASGAVQNPDTADQKSYDLGAGQVVTRLDMIQLADVTFTLGDGSTFQLEGIRITQMTNGDVFLSNARDPNPFSDLNIQSVSVDSVNTVDYARHGPANDFTNSQIVCFAQGTLITTDHGEVAVEDLEIGQKVLTRDSGFQKIRWIGSRKVSCAELSKNAKLRPIRIRADALGSGTPALDLVVSPQHRILLRSPIVQRMLQTREALVAAKQLLEIEGIEIVDDLREVEYFHFLFDDHQIVFANGAETESMYTGQEALKSVGRVAREEIFSIFPELLHRDGNSEPIAARHLLKGRQGRALARRHAKNARQLVG